MPCTAVSGRRRYPGYATQRKAPTTRRARALVVATNFVYAGLKDSPASHPASLTFFRRRSEPIGQIVSLFGRQPSLAASSPKRGVLAESNIPHPRSSLAHRFPWERASNRVRASASRGKGNLCAPGWNIRSHDAWWAAVRGRALPGGGNCGGQRDLLQGDWRRQARRRACGFRQSQ